MDLSEAELVELGKTLFVSSILASVTPDDLGKIIKWCKINNKNYVDMDFPPSTISLVRNPKKSEKGKLWKKFVWRRAKEFLTDGPIKVFVGGITPDDIRQGALGDVYFLCALTILAEKPSRIDRLFITKESNEYGAYAVELYVHGEKKTVVIDDYFPCTSATGGPCFSKANGSELWVMILEKAWAKIYGSYERTERGTSDAALRDLTGAPAVTYKFEEGTWEKILEGISNDFIISASAGNNKSSQQILEGIGLIGSLSYVVIRAQEVDTSSGKVKLVMVRNPWSNAEWQGDWSDHSSLWTPELKKLLSFSEEQDGTFWMSFEDFKDYFSSVTICRINDNYTYNYLKSKHLKGSYNVIKLEVASPGFSYISANQMERHCFSKNFEYEYSNCRMIVAKETETGLVYVTGKQGFDRNLWIGLDLESGSYQIYLEYEWKATINHFVVSTYGEAQVNFSSLGEIPTFITDVYSAKALASGPKVASSNDPELIKHHEVLPEGFGYFYVVNQSEKTLTEKCYFKTFKNLQILPPHGGSKYEVKLAPTESAIIILKAAAGQKPSLNFSSTIVVENLENPLEEPLEDPLELKVKTEGALEQRLHPETEEEIGVQVYSLKEADGMYVLYENTSETTVYEETIEYTLRNAKIVGVDGKQVSFTLKPGEKFFIELRSTAKSWSVKSSSSYIIS